jgi:hypothetical protein
MMKYKILSASSRVIPIMLLLGACGCQFEQAPKKTDRPIKTPDIALEAIECARKIVSDPSNWKKNTGLLTDLSDYVQDLNIAEAPEFKEFNDAALGLIQFGTVWISRSDQSDISQLRSELSKLTSKTEGRLKLVLKVPYLEKSRGHWIQIPRASRCRKLLNVRSFRVCKDSAQRKQMSSERYTLVRRLPIETFAAFCSRNGRIRTIMNWRLSQTDFSFSKHSGFWHPEHLSTCQMLRPIGDSLARSG